MTESPIVTADIQRPPKEILEGLAGISSATASGELHRLGIRSPHLQGLTSWIPGCAVVGPALTLQFMPMREDIYGGGEYVGPERQLHRHALYHTQPGDIVVVDARGDMTSGVFGEMMLTYFCGRGGLAAVVDGCIRDFPKAKEAGLGLWLRHYAQLPHADEHLPFAVNVPIACGGVLDHAGDIIIADDDGAVVVPSGLPPTAPGGQRPCRVGGLFADAPGRGGRSAQVLSALR